MARMKASEGIGSAAAVILLILILIALELYAIVFSNLLEEAAHAGPLLMYWRSAKRYTPPGWFYS